jgi:hypothetical protein
LLPFQSRDSPGEFVPLPDIILIAEGVMVCVAGPFEKTKKAVSDPQVLTSYYIHVLVLGLVLAKHRHSTVAGPVITNEKADMGMVLRKDAVDLLAEVFGSIIG